MKKLTELKVLIFFAMSAVYINTQSANITSVQSGNWISASTWAGGIVPGKDDNVTIASGHTVSYFVSMATTVDLCTNLLVDGVLQASNSTNTNFLTNIYGSIVCNGSIVLGQTGTNVTGMIVTLKGAGASLTGTGSAVFRTINLNVNNVNFINSIPSVTCTHAFYIGAIGSKITIQSGSTVNIPGFGIVSGTVSVAQNGGQGTGISSMDIYGTLNCQTLLLCNNATGTDKCAISVKNGGVLSVSTEATPIRKVGAGIAGTIGGTGCIFTVENGGKFNFSTPGADPELCTVSGNTPYDSKLTVAYLTGSNINGTTTLTNNIGGTYSQLNTPTTNSTTNLSTSGFTANWSTVNNASGYDLQISSGSSLIKTYTVIGQSTNNLSISELSPGTIYTYSVVANAGLNYISSPPSSPISVTTLKTDQTITFGTLSSKTYGDESFTLSASGGASGNPVIFSSSDETITTCTGTNGATVTILKAGVCTIYANQAGNETFNAATEVAQTLTIQIKNETIISNSNLTEYGWTNNDLLNTDILVSNGELVIDQNTDAHSITIVPGAKLTLNSGKTLSTGTFVLQSSATGTATFVDENTNASENISATVQQYLPETNRNWYVSAPITSASNNNFNTGTGVVEYNEEAGTWYSVNGTLQTMKGYITVASSTSSTGTVNFDGILNNGEKFISLSRKGTSKAGFNLIGNPYPSYLMWTESLANSANCLSTIWYRTKSDETYTFETYNAPSGLGVPATTTGYIPPMQAFWVRTSIDGSVLRVDNSMRSHGNGLTNLLKVPSTSNSDLQLVRLQVSNGLYNDETLLYFNPNASNDFDSYDSPKMSNNNTSIPEIYTTAGTEQLVINGMKRIPENIEIPLGFNSGNSSSFSLKATKISNSLVTFQILLKDNARGSIQELNSGNAYNFDNSYSSKGRFSLIFKSPSEVTSINKLDNPNTEILIFRNNNNQITVNCKEIDIQSFVTIFNAVGQKIFSKKLTEDITTLKDYLCSGLYMVTVENSRTKLTKKIILQ